MQILVIGGTGTVGTGVVRALRDRGREVRVLTRSPDEVARPIDGAEYIGGDLGDPGSLAAAFEGTDRVYLVTALDPREAELGLAAVEAAGAAGVSHLVFQSVHRAGAARHLPHFASKLEIIEGIRASGIPYTLISPNSFYQNDLGLRDPLVEGGVYPVPTGPIGVSRVDVGDIADAAATVLTGSGHEGAEYAIVGPEALTGERTAEIWSRHLGREVFYTGDDLEAFAAQLRPTMPDWMFEDLYMMFDFFTREGLAATDSELEALRALLGREPRDYDAFVAEMAADWLA